MIPKIKTISNLGLVWYEVLVEADSSKALPNIEIVWLPDSAVKESKERIRSTFRNVWIDLPPRKMVLNLAPSDLKKTWTRYDLPMAVALFAMIEPDRIDMDKLDKVMFVWELGLDGTVRKVNWALPSVLSASKLGYKDFFVPADNMYELQYLEWINIYPVSHFQQVKDFLTWATDLDNLDALSTNLDTKVIPEVDFADIKWHMLSKQALMVAAAWQHNVLMIWAPWSGKTLLAKALQGIMPWLQYEEVLEVSQIYSVQWKLDQNNPLITQRPFRPVHHTASKVSIIWWWANLSPWEISLAHKGILFFDELPEFPREVLEVLRQPLEDRTITISRVSGTINYPAQFMFVAAMNPCKCWYYKDPQKHCRCSLTEIKRYQGKISWPLLDRFDMILEVPREDIDSIMDKTKQQSSADLAAQVHTAWQMQVRRFAATDIFSNSSMWPKHIDKYINLSTETESSLKKAVKSLSLSPRVVHRILKLARTIADLQSQDDIAWAHVAQALQYRSKTMFVWEDF